MKYLFKIIFLFLFFVTTTFGDELTDKLDKINKELHSIGKSYLDGVLSEEDYKKAKKKLLDQAEATKKAAKAKKKTKVAKPSGDELTDKLNKIDELLDSAGKLYDSGMLSEEDYKKTKKKLLDQAEAAKKAAEAKKKTKVAKTPAQQAKSDKVLNKQLEVIKKLFDDGVLTEEEYNKTKKTLLDKAKTAVIAEPKVSGLTPNITVAESDRVSWEKAEIIYGDYKIYTHRPGGVKIKRISDEKTLVVIADNFNVKYYNGGEGIFDIDITRKEITSIAEERKRKGLEKQKLFQKAKRIPFDKNEHKLELKKDGVKLLHYEGRYVPKHRAFFYQVLTGNYTPFHFYIKISGKGAIALNMEMFNRKIDLAVRKAKKKIAAEFDVTEAQIDDIINKKVEEEADKAVDQALEEAVAKSVEEAIAESVGAAMASTLVNAIEQATGEAIEAAVENELAAAIDAEIAAAVAAGIEEAAVTAGWEAYFDTLAAGGTMEEASANAYEACGSACDNY